MGLADLSGGSAGEDEDYYMQDLLTRDQYNQVQMLEKPVASIPNRKEHSGQNNAKKVPRGKAESSRQMDTKSGKRTLTQTLFFFERFGFKLSCVYSKKILFWIDKLYTESSDQCQGQLISNDF